MTTRRPGSQGFPWRRLSIVLAASAMGAVPDATHAALITVSAQCSLRDALASAESDLPVSSGCVQGSGADTVRLPPNSVQTLTSPLPEISNDLVIEGQGSTIRRAEGASPFRILAIRSPAVVELRGLTISNGEAEGGGGGVLNQSQLTMTECVVTGNRASGSGGGIRSDSYLGGLTLRNSAVTNNRAGYSGGGIAGSGDISIRDSAIVGNRISPDVGSVGGGAGLSIFDSRTILERSTVAGNSSDLGQASAIQVYLASIELSNSTVSGNLGTGVAARYGSIDVVDSTIAMNTFGVFSNDAPMNLQRSIISGNVSGQVGFVTEYYGVDAPVVTSSSNVFGSSAQTTAQALRGFSPSASDIVATSDGTAPTALDKIILSALAHNGGPTATHALPAGSPALDGVDAGCAETDQRGVSRAQNLGCDIGAFELETLASNGPTLSFSTSLVPVPESQGREPVVLRLSEPSATNVSARIEIRGSAQAEDYRVPRAQALDAESGENRVLSVPVTLRAGRTEVSVPVVVRNDRKDEPAENVVLSLVSVEGAEPGTRALSTLVIEDDDPTPVINFLLASSTVSEATSVRNLRVTLSRPSHRDLTADLVFDGTARQFADFEAPESVTIPAGKTSALIPITILDDDEVEVPETILISLESNSDDNDFLRGDLQSGTRAQHTMRLRSNE